jgi:very-long-chain (3R)-3-hydroxyacyl-CoA dehydratase
MKSAVKYYLGAYNLIAFLFWAAYLICFIASGFQLNNFNLILLNIAQGLAILEILHALLKWVKSPVLSTIAQVASRLLVLVLIDVFIEGPSLHPITNIGVMIVSIAWGLTEIIRYSLYFLSLTDVQPKWLLWARYSFFIILYPCGVTGEWLIIAAPIITHGFTLNAYNVFVIFLAISYIYYFPVLYRYMWKQRKAKL